MTFDFGTLIAHAAKTRALCAGTIVGSGTVSNRDADGGPGKPIGQGGVGYSCIAEMRTVETLLNGEAKTPFLKPGDQVRIEMKGRRTPPLDLRRHRAASDCGALDPMRRRPGMSAEVTVFPRRPESEDRLVLDDYLPYRLSVASNAVSRLIARAYEDRFGLSIPQWRLIAVLAQDGALTPGALVARTAMDKVTISRAAQQLLKRHLIGRVAHEADGRSHRLSLTAEGQRLHADIAPWPSPTKPPSSPASLPAKWPP